jgi:DNA modification methylase
MTTTPQIYHRDYHELLADLADDSISLILSDPPFGIGYQNNYTKSRHRLIAGDDNRFSYSDLANEAKRVLVSDGAVLLYTGWSTYPAHYIELDQAGFRIREPYIVQKRPSGKTGLKVDSQSNCDWILYATLGKHQFRQTQLLRNKRAGTIPNPGRKPVPEWKTRFPSCWFGSEFPYSTTNPSTLKMYRHPTPKDPRLMEWLIRIHTDPSDLVVDPFCGSGPVAEACVRSDRRFIGGDIDAEYVEMSRNRIDRIMAEIG